MARDERTAHHHTPLLHSHPESCVCWIPPPPGLRICGPQRRYQLLRSHIGVARVVVGGGRVMVGGIGIGGVGLGGWMGWTKSDGMGRVWIWSDRVGSGRISRVGSVGCGMGGAYLGILRRCVMRPADESGARSLQLLPRGMCAGGTFVGDIWEISGRYMEISGRYLGDM